MVEYTGQPQGHPGLPHPPGPPYQPAPPYDPKTPPDLNISRSGLALFRVLVLAVGMLAVSFSLMFAWLMVLDAPMTGPEFRGIREAGVAAPWLVCSALIAWLVSFVPRFSRRTRVGLLCVSSGLFGLATVGSVVWMIVRYKMVKS